MELFETCRCGGDCGVTLIRPRSYGSLLKVQSTCNLCNEVKIWQSQPRIAGIPAGNLAISKGILFGGESPSKFLRTLKNSGVHAISPRTFHEHQATYLQPAVVNVWKSQQAALLAELKAKGEPLTLGGDGRADSPGHTAKYGSYTMMDLNSGKIIDIQLVQVIVTISSIFFCCNSATSCWHCVKTYILMGNPINETQQTYFHKLYLFIYLFILNLFIYIFICFIWKVMRYLLHSQILINKRSCV